MTALLKIDQAGLSAGVAGRSRTDGLATGALVTLTNTGSGTTLMRLLWAPPGDTTALSSLAVTGDPKVWTFSPTASKYGTYLVELIADQGLVTEKRERRVLVVRTPNRKLVIPALNERGDNAASLLAAGQAQDEASNNNAVDYLDATLNGVPYAGWWRAIHEMMMALDTGIAGSNLVGVGQVLGRPIDGAAGPAFPLTGAQVASLLRSPDEVNDTTTSGTVVGYAIDKTTRGVRFNCPAPVTVQSIVVESGQDVILRKGGATAHPVTFEHESLAESNASRRIQTPDSRPITLGGTMQAVLLRHHDNRVRLYPISVTTKGVTNDKLDDMAAGRVKLRALDTGTGVPIDGTAAQLDAIMRTVAGVQRVVSVDTTVQTWSGDNLGRTVGGTVIVPTTPAGTAYRIRAHLTIVFSAVPTAPTIELGLRYGSPAGAFEEQLVTLATPPTTGTYHAAVEGTLQLLGTARMFLRAETNMPPSAPLQFGAKGVAVVAGSLWMRARLVAASGLANATITVENAYVERLY